MANESRESARPAHKPVGVLSTKRSSMAFLVQIGLPLSSDYVVVDMVVDGDGDGDVDGDELHRHSLVSIATVRASNSIP